MRTIRELLTTGVGTEGSLLIEKKIYDTLWDAVRKTLIGRSTAAFVIAPSGIPGSSVDVDLVTPNSMVVFAVSEGAPIPIDVEAYTSTNLKPTKYGVRIPVTKEMMEDGKWDLMAYNIRTAGIKFAENEDTLILAALDGATNVVTGGAALTLSNITRAIQYLEDSDYTATDLLVGPEVANDLRNIDTFTNANIYGSDDQMQNGLVGKIFGLEVRRFSATIGTSTRAYVLDRNQAFCLAEKRPVTVEKYDDVTHDLSGASVTQRLTVALLRDAAVARITTT